MKSPKKWNCFEVISIQNSILKYSYPGLLVAYIDEVEERYGDKVQKLGEGKTENQNNAIIFTWGEALQTTDMNQVNWVVMVHVTIYVAICVVFTNYLQDNYLEEASKMRNLLEEFNKTMVSVKPRSWSVWAHIYRKVGWKLYSFHCIFFTLIHKSGTNFWEWWIVVCRHLHGWCRTRRPALWQ